MSSVFLFKDTATTEIYTLSLHDALPILRRLGDRLRIGHVVLLPLHEWLNIDWRNEPGLVPQRGDLASPVMSAGASLHSHQDRKSTRLNSSHANISYAVFCLKKNKTKLTT